MLILKIITINIRSKRPPLIRVAFCHFREGNEVAPIRLCRCTYGVELECCEGGDDGEYIVVADHLDDNFACGVDVILDVLGIGDCQNFKGYQVSMDLVCLVSYGAPLPTGLDLLTGPLIMDLFCDRIKDHLRKAYESTTLVSQDRENCYRVCDVSLFVFPAEFIIGYKQRMGKLTLCRIVVYDRAVYVAFCHLAFAPTVVASSCLALSDNLELRIELYCHGFAGYLLCVLCCGLCIKLHSANFAIRYVRRIAPP